MNQHSRSLSAIAGFGDVQKAAGSPPSSKNSGGVTSFRQTLETKLAANDMAALSRRARPDAGPKV